MYVFAEGGRNAKVSSGEIYLTPSCCSNSTASLCACSNTFICQHISVDTSITYYIHY